MNIKSVCLGARLREIRKSRGLTLKELSKLCDISITYLSEIENGHRTLDNMSFKNISQLAGALGTNAYYLTAKEEIIKTSQEKLEKYAKTFEKFEKILSKLADKLEHELGL